jgi:tetratricopeptide (TPR) repeat protein
MVCNRIGPAMAEPYWNRYLVGCEAAKSLRETPEPAASNVNARPPMTDAMLLACLENAVSWDPEHARAELALAEMHLKLFEAKQKTAKNRMSLTSIRDAALEANFRSRDELNRWLERAIGDSAENLKSAHLHCRRSLALRPLQGHGYVYLAGLSFLDGDRGPSKRDCIRQAMLLRPFDGAVALAAASEALLDGDEAQWLELTKRSFDRGRKYQRQIVGELIGRASPENVQEIIAFIEESFQPDRQGLDILYEACAKRCPPNQLVDLNLARAIATEKDASQLGGAQAAYLWLRAQNIYVDLGDGSRAFLCVQNALKSDPNNYDAHYQFASRLLERDMFSEAENELQWCRQRKPGDQYLEIRTKAAIKARLNAERGNTGSAVRK